MIRCSPAHRESFLLACKLPSGQRQSRRPCLKSVLALSAVSPLASDRSFHLAALGWRRSLMGQCGPGWNQDDEHNRSWATKQATKLAHQVRGTKFVYKLVWPIIVVQPGLQRPLQSQRTCLLDSAALDTGLECSDGLLWGIVLRLILEVEFSLRRIGGVQQARP